MLRNTKREIQKKKEKPAARPELEILSSLREDGVRIIHRNIWNKNSTRLRLQYRLKIAARAINKISHHIYPELPFVDRICS